MVTPKRVAFWGLESATLPRLGSRVRVSFSALSDVLKMTYAQVAELVDAHVSGACVERHAGSSPVLGTKVKL